MASFLLAAILVAQAPAAQTIPTTPWPPPGVFKPGDGVTTPKLVKEVKPNYKAQAMADKIQGRIALEAVVQTDGTVGDVRIMKSLDPSPNGLDEEAVSCLKKWTFTPGKKDGADVPVVIEVEMSFSMGKAGRF
jgi:protein TonB